MRRPVWMISLAIATLVAAGSAAAASLTVGLNQSLRVKLPGAANNVVVVNPAIADVAMVDSHSVIVLGKGYGVTEIMVTDRAGHMLLDTRVAVVGSDAGVITLYRGPQAFSYACAGRCQLMGPEAAVPVFPTAGPASASAVPTTTTMTITSGPAASTALAPPGASRSP